MDSLYSKEFATYEMKFHKLGQADLRDLVELKNESWFGTHTITFANEFSQLKWFEKISEETHCPRNLILVAHVSFIKVGIFKILNIDWQNRKAEVGWDVYKNQRKKGYGRNLVQTGVCFCWDVLNLRRVDAQILSINGPSLKCAKAAGFMQEGLQKKAIYKNGEYVDNLLFGATNAKNT